MAILCQQPDGAPRQYDGSCGLIPFTAGQVKLKSLSFKGKSAMDLLKRNSRLALILCTILQALFAAAQNKAEKELWLSDGYGLLVEIDHDELRAFQLTSISCIPGWSAQRDHKSRRSKESIFIGSSTFRLSDGSSRDVKRLHIDGTTSDIVLHRTSERPATCAATPDNSPQGSYAVFWQTFAEQYPFFKVRQVDWSSVDREFRSQVTSATKPAQLFDLLRDMIEPLQDAHTGIEAPDIKKDFDGWRKDSNHLEDEDWEKAQQLIATRYLRGGLRQFCNGRIQFGMMDHSIGYLRITAFYGYVDGSTYDSEAEALQLALDAIFRSANKLNGLVIDVRLNHGGDDQLGIEIASRLTNNKYLAYAKVTRNNPDGALHFTVPQESWVVPSSRPSFRGNVVLLIGPDTVSAGETFTMALLGRKSHILRIGLNTQGVFSDVLNRTLPNGWRFGLPNEVYLTSDGTSYDASGVPPDIRLNSFSHEDLDNGLDNTLEKAHEILWNSRNKTIRTQP